MLVAAGIIEKSNLSRRVRFFVISVATTLAINLCTTVGFAYERHDVAFA
jgi:hypothetical protein